MANQISIKEKVRIDGVNIYRGRRNHAVFHPAEENSGLAFIVNGERIPARLDFAGNRRCGISLSSGKETAFLVEHLLSAVYALGIDNLDVELSDGVCPTNDRCAKEYFDALKVKDLRKEQGNKKKFWRYAKEAETKLRSPFGREDCLTIKPSEKFAIEYIASYPHIVLGRQERVFEFSERNFEREIAEARAPAFFKTHATVLLMKVLRTLGLYDGANERNYLLVGSVNTPHYLNPQEFGVRYGGQEFVRHKILDVLGTLALTGRQFKETEFSFELTGHKFDMYSLRKLFSEGCFQECE